MDAVKYMKERRRMIYGEIISDERAEAAVKTVEQWSAKHQEKTRADVFAEIFKDSDSNSIFPCEIDKSIRNDNKCEFESCSDCRKNYWSEPAPEGFGKGGVK